MTHKTGPCQVLAGPGSGKTLTIVNRVRFLIETCRVKPEDILVITFTRFAAAEMRSRLSALMGREVPVTAGTFHGIYYGILKWAYHLGPQNILSEEEKYRILQEAVRGKEIEAADEEDFLRDIAAEIGKVKNNRISPEEYEPSRCSAENFCEIYHGYETRRKSLRKIDFDDMLSVCCELFTSRPDLLELWQKKFKYILIDEFQDINRVQYDVIRMLALPENNIFAVGDDDQAIYGFRGADPQIMFRFLKDYPQAVQIILGNNYRSSGNIVRNSLKMIGHNEQRFPKKLSAVRERGECLHIQEAKDPTEEAQYVASEIERAIKGGVAAEEIAVLFRIHTDARAVAEELIDRHIPFQMREHLPNIYNHFIAKDIQAYFRLAMGSGSRGDLLQVMNRPKRYIARDSVSDKGVSFEAIKNFYCDKDWMLDRIDQFEWDLKMLSRMAPYAGIQYIRKKIGYDEFLKLYAGSHAGAGADRPDSCEILAELEEASRPYASAEEWFRHIGEYTETLRRKEKERSEEREGVRLMTLHAAKGLEFHTVFLIGANEGCIPYKKVRTDAGTEEERRLFYVGMTRAQDVLKISYVKTKNGKESSPSRFIEELLEDG